MPYLGTQPSRGLVGTAGIDADAVTNAKIADDQIDSEHYVDGSIDTAHIANSQITTGKIATNAIDGTLTKDALIADYSDVTVTASDLIMYGDATDSNNTKRDTVQGILDLAGGGKLVSRYYHEYATHTSTATAIPADDTIPQISEGVQILTITTDTLGNSSNRLRIFYGGCFTSNTVGAACAAAIFDGASNALHNVVHYPTSTNSYEYQLNGFYEYAPGATTAKTITMRYGNNSSYVMYINGQSGQRFYGGASKWVLIVEEIEP